jgi:hypothetical protein
MPLTPDGRSDATKRERSNENEHAEARRDGAVTGKTSSLTRVRDGRSILWAHRHARRPLCSVAQLGLGASFLFIAFQRGSSNSGSSPAAVEMDDAGR